jgi:hypothetical protein
MTISDLIAQLSSYPLDARVTLLDSNRRWLLPIEINTISANCSSCGVDLVVITTDYDSDEIEGLAIQPPVMQANSNRAYASHLPDAGQSPPRSPESDATA